MKNLAQEEYIKAYDEFSDAIFRYCYLRVSDREKAKDIMQETFIKVWEYVTNGNVVEKVRPLLYKTASNLIIDDYRKKRAVSLDALAEEGFEPASDEHKAIESSFELSQAMKFIHRLEDKHREVIIMRYVDDMYPKEIAEIIGETENNISVRINRAVKKVRELIKNGE